MASYGNSQVSGVATTTNGTWTVATTLDFPAESTAELTLKLVARNASNNDSKIWNRICCVKRTSSGVSILSGIADVINPIGDLGALLWTTDIDSDETHIYIRVKGVNGSTIDWLSEVVILYITE